jgi:hypothetical protein
MTETGGGEEPAEVRSVFEITQSMMELLRGADGAAVDITDMAARLGVQRRRLYDVANVLCSVNLIKRDRFCRSKLRLARDDQGPTVESDAVEAWIEEQLSKSCVKTPTITADEALMSCGASRAFALVGSRDLSLELSDRSWARMSLKVVRGSFTISQIHAGVCEAIPLAAPG